MATLEMGAKGDAVKRLQRRLKRLGFNPGDIDGQFGPATDAAVRGFQASEGLLIDGIAGQRTLAALGIKFKVRASDVFDIDALTSIEVAPLFPGAPIGNIKTYLPCVLTALRELELADKSMVLMALGTIRAETSGFEPISEYRSRYNSSPNGHPFDLYDSRKDLGNEGPLDGERFRGRGFVQLTGRFNYREIGRAIGLGERLLNEPELANEANIAARILATFLKSKEIAIKTALLENDLCAARRLVNGGSHGLDRFDACFRLGERTL